MSRASAAARTLDDGAAITLLRRRPACAQQLSRGATGQDFIEASVIDARLRQLTAQRRQLQLDARETRGGRNTPEENPPQ